MKFKISKKQRLKEEYLLPILKLSLPQYFQQQMKNLQPQAAQLVIKQRHLLIQQQFNLQRIKELLFFQTSKEYRIILKPKQKKQASSFCPVEFQNAIKSKQLLQEIDKELSFFNNSLSTTVIVVKEYSEIEKLQIQHQIINKKLQKIYQSLQFFQTNNNQKSTKISFLLKKY